MCYGDIDHGKDGYYRDWMERQQQEEPDCEGPSAVDGQQGEPRKLPVEAGSIPVPLSNDDEQPTPDQPENKRRDDY